MRYAFGVAILAVAAFTAGWNHNPTILLAGYAACIACVIWSYCHAMKRAQREQG